MKELVVLGGPNGAGKTTAAQVVVPRKLGIAEFVNADEIARGLSPYHALELRGYISQSEHCLLSSVSLLEISMVLAGFTGDATSWMELDALIARAGMQVVAPDTELTEATRGAFLRYGKGRHLAGLNLGDCASYALAKHRNLPLLFKGNDFPKTDLRSAA